MKKKDVAGQPPVLEFGSLSFEASNYRRGSTHWMATTLLRACEEQGLEPFEYPLAAYHLSDKCFRLDNMDDFIWQMKRTLDADYSKPIILDGNRSIMAYRLQYMPKPDFVDKED